MNNKKALRMSVLSLIFATALSVTAAFAWFNIDKHSGVENFHLNVTHSKIMSADIETYAVSAVEMDDNQPVNFTLATEGDELVSLTDMPIYATLSPENSLYKYKPVLAIKITFELSQTTQCFLNVFTEKDFILSSSNWLSNCTSFEVAQYDEVNNKLSIQGQQTVSFVNLTENQIQKPVKNINIISGTFPQGQKTIWIILRYKDEIIDIIHAENITSEHIEYKNDIFFEII